MIDGPASEQNSCPPPLRLGTGHLLLWMTTCAAVLAGYRLLNDPRDLQESRFAMLFQLVMSVGYSLAITALLVLLSRRRQGDRRFPTHAGHWLAIMGVITLLIDACSLAGVKLYAASCGQHWQDFWVPYQAIGWSVGTAIAIGFLIGVRQEWRWRVVMAAIVGLALQNALGYGLTWAGFYIPWLPPYDETLGQVILGCGILVILCALVRDLQLAAPRDWLHWSGAIAWLGLGSIQLTASIYHRLSP